MTVVSDASTCDYLLQTCVNYFELLRIDVMDLNHKTAVLFIVLISFIYGLTNLFKSIINVFWSWGSCNWEKYTVSVQLLWFLNNVRCLSIAWASRLYDLKAFWFLKNEFSILILLSFLVYSEFFFDEVTFQILIQCFNFRICHQTKFQWHFIIELFMLFDLFDYKFLVFVW